MTKPPEKSDQEIIPLESIQQRIYLIRGHKVMLDSDLAELYAVQTFNLNKAVKRNIDRFPADFMFQLTKEEAERLTFQIGMSKPSGYCRSCLRKNQEFPALWSRTSFIVRRLYAGRRF